uniref:class I SAM-dependent methyltransferase n=1 Tax=Polynucleobacter sp. TaxID=2029855 RepID=UPI004048910B
MKGVVLDVGCGPGNQSKSFVSSKKYIGIDFSETYISDARKLCGDFGEFFVLSATEIEKLPVDNIDLVILGGVFHHLSDDDVRLFLSKVKTKLSKFGAVVSVDPTYKMGRPIANKIAAMDRGLNVRWADELVNLAKQYLSIEEKLVIEQRFPPYQRVMLKMSRSDID